MKKALPCNQESPSFLKNLEIETSVGSSSMDVFFPNETLQVFGFKRAQVDIAFAACYSDSAHMRSSWENVHTRLSDIPPLGIALSGW